MVTSPDSLPFMTLARELVEEFPDVPQSLVILTLTDCAREAPHAGRLSVKQRVRARLADGPRQ